MVAKQQQLYSGKAKTVFLTDDPNRLIIHYRNDTSAFNGVKLAKLDRKGKVNNYFNAFIMQALQNAGIPTHFEEVVSAEESLMKRLDMIPVEFVLRNWVAGGLAKRLGLEEGMELTMPVLELFYKSDVLNDPMINEYHVRCFGWATDAEIETMKALTFRVNEVLKPLFMRAGMWLVDYKLEFGRHHGQIILGDEFTPDGCRIWDATTGKKLDKDRFRRDLGDVVESYEEVAARLGIVIPE